MLNETSPKRSNAKSWMIFIAAISHCQLIYISQVASGQVYIGQVYIGQSAVSGQ